MAVISKTGMRGAWNAAFEGANLEWQVNGLIPAGIFYSLGACAVRS